MKNFGNCVILGIVLMITFQIYNVAGECISLAEKLTAEQEDCKRSHFAEHLFGYFRPGCIAACAFTKMNFMVDDKFVIEDIENFFTENLNDPELADRVNERMRLSTMRANMGRDRCETAHIFIETNRREESYDPIMNQVFCAV